MMTSLEHELWKAVAENDFDQAKAFITKYGASLGLSRPKWVSWRCAPLHMAAWRGNSAILRLLIEAGADVNSYVVHDNGDFETALHVVSRRLARRYNRWKESRNLLLLFGADPGLPGRFVPSKIPHDSAPAGALDDQVWVGTPGDFYRAAGES